VLGVGDGGLEVLARREQGYVACCSQEANACLMLQFRATDEFFYSTAGNLYRLRINGQGL
jgi:hypothetical protein